MYIDFKKIFIILSLIILGVILGVTGTKIINRYQAPKQTVSVTGTGEIDAVTDQATINIQIKTNSTTYKKAQEENKKDVDKLKSELVKLGIPESRISISSYYPPIISNMAPPVDYVGIPEGKMMPAYRSDTNLTVTTSLTLILDPIKNIEKVYEVVSKNINAQIINSYYSLKNKKTWESKAKNEALKDIRNQIESIAKINRLRVGKLLTLDDGNNPRPYPIPMKALNGQTTYIEDQSLSPNQEVNQIKTDNVYYGEQSVKITSSYTATYELY